MSKRKQSKGAKKPVKTGAKKKAAPKKKPTLKKKNTAKKKSSLKKPGTKTKKIAIKKSKSKARKPSSSKIVTNGTVDLECFLSTACAQHMKLGDQCSELQELRRFRDGFMLNHPEGRELVKDYKRIAPGLVHTIEADRQKGKVYAYIYGEIQKAIGCIQNGQLLESMQVYKNMVLHLEQKYKTEAQAYMPEM